MRLYKIPYTLFIISICIILPVVYSRLLFDPVQTIQLFFIGILCIPFFLLLLSKPSKNQFFIGYFDLIFFLFSSFTTVSIVNSNDTSITIFEVCKLLLFFTTYKIFQYFFSDNRFSTNLIWIAISIHVVFQCILALFQIKTGITNVDPSYRFLGTMTHSNIFSECILFSLPFIVIARKQLRRTWKCLPMIALLLSILLIIVAQTRAVWVGTAAGFLVVLLFLAKNKHLSFFTILLKNNVNWVLLSIIIVVSVFILFLKNEWDQVYSHIISLLKLDPSLRDYLWKSTIPIVKSNFLFGVGPGNWRFHIPVVNHIAYQRPHNDYLWVFAESGVFAFIAFAGIFLYTILKLLKNIKTAQKDNLPVLYTLLFGIIAYCTDSFFAFPKERPYLLILLALLFAYTHSLIPEKPLLKVSPRLFSAIALVIAIFSSWFCWNRMQGEITNKRIIDQASLSPSEKMDLLKKIKLFYYSADPFSMPIKSLEGSIWIDIGNFENAKSCYLDAHTMAPLNPEICINIGSISEMTSDRSTSRTFYNKALAIEPWNVQALLNLAVIEYKDGEKGNAAELVKKINPGSIAGQENLLTQYEILKSSLRL